MMGHKEDLMIYLHRYATGENGQATVEIAAVEEARHAEKYEAKGYNRCTLEEFRAAWRLRDQQRLAEIWAILGLQRERSVGDPNW
jgi:hypothetical protein